MLVSFLGQEAGLQSLSKAQQTLQQRVDGIDSRLTTA